MDDISKELLFHETILSIAREYTDRGRTLDELMAAGKEGLKVAEEKYDSERIFDAIEVEDYIDDGKTALCPYCSVDSVIGDASVTKG